MTPACAPQRVDALVIGAGFYGCAIAIYLARQRGLRHIVLAEREESLLARASYHNQARVHNGYHYPRSFTTAYRSRINLPHFVRDWPSAIRRDFTKVYAIARRNSKVTARQFQRFCRDIGAPLDAAGPSLRQLFDPQLVEQVFLAEEYGFDSTKLAAWAAQELAGGEIDLRLSTTVTALAPLPGGRLLATLDGLSGAGDTLAARYVFNCTYAGLNQLGGAFPGSAATLKHEITEMALMTPPTALAGLGVTVMDGPFFSFMPFPPRGLHSLSHVRYTPHLHWQDQAGVDPYARLDAYDKVSRADRMVRAACRLLPALADARYEASLFEVKTMLTKNEADDGRPILFDKHAALPGCYSILGGKIDNIYDVLERLNAESFERA